MIRKIFKTAIYISLVAGLFWTGCTHEPSGTVVVEPIDPGPGPIIPGMNPSEPCEDTLVYFSRDVLPILVSNCAEGGCHDPASHRDDIILTTYELVMETADVRPFDLDGGKLFEVITDSDPDDRMPPPPNSPLTASQINVIKKWIEQGAFNLVCDFEGGVCDTTAVTYSQTIFPIIQNHCLGCHSGTNPGGMLDYSTHGGFAGPALGGIIVGAIRHQNGFAPMPLNGTKLPECKIRQIEIWIADGAPNN